MIKWWSWIGILLVPYFFLIFYQTLLQVLLLIGLWSRHIKQKIQRLYCTHHKIKGNLTDQQIYSPNHVFALADMKKIITWWSFPQQVLGHLLFQFHSLKDCLSGWNSKDFIGFCYLSPWVCSEGQYCTSISTKPECILECGNRCI